MDTDLITAQEFNWIVNNEPSFHVENNSFIGKVGRTATGKDIIIQINLPAEFYPIVKPEVYMRTSINHPNIDQGNKLALQLLEEWDPSYRIKDIIISARRLFLRSKNLVDEVQAPERQVSRTPSAVVELQNEIQNLQQEIRSYSQKINQERAEKLEDTSIKSVLGHGAVPISATHELEATQKALIDLLGLIEYKFEDASMDEVVFFRLYRKYIREHYIVTKKLQEAGGTEHVVSKQKTKEAIRN